VRGHTGGEGGSKRKKISRGGESVGESEQGSFKKEEKKNKNGEDECGGREKNWGIDGSKFMELRCSTKWTKLNAENDQRLMKSIKNIFLKWGIDG